MSVLIFGPSGSGKTYVGARQCCSLTSALPFQKHPKAQRVFRFCEIQPSFYCCCRSQIRIKKHASILPEPVNVYRTAAYFVRSFVFILWRSFFYRYG